MNPVPSGLKLSPIGRVQPITTHLAKCGRKTRKGKKMVCSLWAGNKNKDGSFTRFTINHANTLKVPIKQCTPKRKGEKKKAAGRRAATACAVGFETKRKEKRSWRDRQEKKWHEIRIWRDFTRWGEVGNWRCEKKSLRRDFSRLSTPEKRALRHANTVSSLNGRVPMCHLAHFFVISQVFHRLNFQPFEC